MGTMNSAHNTISRIELSEAYEGACATAAKMYAEGLDTTKIDAECDRLEALLNEAN
jgi:hypothetical protein